MSIQDITGKPVAQPVNHIKALKQAVAAMAEFDTQVITVSKTFCVKKLRTPAEARAWLEYQGISIAQWARENEKSDSLVREILAGKKKCHRGESHNIAVLLGMKEGILTNRPGRVSPMVLQRAVA